MRKIDIILVNPPLEAEGRGDFGIKKDVVVPLQGLCSLAAVLRKAGIEVSILDSPALSLSMEDTVINILEFSPRFVGISATTIAIYEANELASRLKQKDNEIVTILGGAHLSALPKETMEQFPNFDIGVIGEGELTLLELLQAYDSKVSLDKVTGIIYRRGNEPVETPPRPLIENLDSLPLPAWDLLPNLTQYYQQSVARAERLPAAPLVTSRGCPGRCIFCGHQVFGRSCRAYSAERVLEMMKHLRDRYGIKSIVFNDDNFTMFRKRLKTICETIISQRIDLPWSCFSRVDNINPELLQLMRQAGCKGIAYGIESGVQEILDFEKKGITLSRIEEAVSETKKAGIRVTGYFILGHPLETEKTIRETIDFAKKLRLDDFLLSYMVPYPGSYLYEIAAQYGDFQKDWRTMNQWNLNFIPRDLSREKMEYYFQKAFKEFYFRPRILYSHILRALRPKYVKRYLKEGLNVMKFILKRAGQKCGEKNTRRID